MRGGSIIIEETKNEIRQYLLGRLTDEAEERIELRLLTDADFAEEFDIMVDQVADEFALKSVSPPELDEIQRHFLKANQRRNKTKFASALLNYQQRSAPSSVSTQNPSFLERIRNSWNRQAISLQIASAVCALLVVCIAVVFVQWRSSPKNVLAVTLTSSNLTRGETGGKVERVRLPADVGTLKVSLRLPEQSKGPTTYRVEVVDSSGKPNSIAGSAQDDQTVIVSLNASDLEPGQYALRLFGTDSAGSEQRVGGTYTFIVER